MLCAASASVVFAADQTIEREAIEKAIQSYTNAFNAGDAKALADHWSEGAIYVNPNTGVEAQRRDAIASQFASILSELKNTKPTREV
jgi:ketosteroid isomerase-like protein